MILIIPIGGNGRRFKEHHYEKPKALIDIYGKPMIFYLLDHLNLESITKIVIPYHRDYYEYNFEHIVSSKYPGLNFKFYKLENDTEGAAHTLYIALKKLEKEEDQPIISLDCDNFYTADIIQLWNGQNKVITIESHDEKPIFSYIQMKDHQIVDIKEKEKISNYACTGAYGFNSYKTLLYFLEKMLEKKIKQKNEYYISCVIYDMIKNNILFDYEIINQKEWICLGTPKQLLQFLDK